MSSTAPLRLVSTSTVPRNTRARETQQPVINITLQTDDRKVLTVADAAHCLGISRSKLYPVSYTHLTLPTIYSV